LCKCVYQRQEQHTLLHKWLKQMIFFLSLRYLPFKSPFRLYTYIQGAWDIKYIYIQFMNNQTSKEQEERSCSLSLYTYSICLSFDTLLITHFGIETYVRARAYTYKETNTKKLKTRNFKFVLYTDKWNLSHSTADLAWFKGSE